MQPDSKQIFHSSCYRRMLDDTFLRLLTAEGMKWSKRFSVSWIKSQKSEPWKKVLRDLNHHACVKGLKGDLTALYLPCVYSVLRVLQFPLVISNSWGKKSLIILLPLLIISFWFYLLVMFICLFPCFPLTSESLPRGVWWDVLLIGTKQNFLQNLGGNSSTCTQGGNVFQAEGRTQFIGQSSADL